MTRLCAVFHRRPRPGVIFHSFGHEAELRALLRRSMPYSNGVRLHSGIGYSSPIAYEAADEVCWQQGIDPWEAEQHDTNALV